MKRQKLTQQEQEQHAAEHEAQQQTAKEFATPEEMLRHDALHTPIPPAVAHRLEQSLANVPPPPKTWWRRWFGS